MSNNADSIDDGEDDASEIKASSASDQFILRGVSQTSGTEDKQPLEFLEDEGESQSIRTSSQNITSKTDSVQHSLNSQGNSTASSGGKGQPAAHPWPKTHLRALHRMRVKEKEYIQKSMRKLDTTGVDSAELDTGVTSGIQQKSQLERAKVLSAKIARMVEFQSEWTEAIKDHAEDFSTPCEVRMHDFSYSVVVKQGADKVQTVFNSSFIYRIQKWYRRARGKEGPEPEPTEKIILQDINLILDPGKSYLLLGAPGSGKTTLLRAITGHIRLSRRRRMNKNRTICGRILYNGRSLDEGGEEFHIENVVTYIDQLDKHAPRLTVRETFEFAFQCKAGGTCVREKHLCRNQNELDILAKYDLEHVRVNSLLVGLGLDHVADTFVGDTSVRGVSGGQRRRVTVGEMMADRAPVLCGDEISTGLDATSTFDMVELLVHFGSLSALTRVIALLQPSPETVSLFDEIIVLSAGRIIFCGPVVEVENYFDSLGFKAPAHIDVADFIQQISTDGGAEFYDPPEEVEKKYPGPPTPELLADIFRNSELGNRIREKLATSSLYTWKREESDKLDGAIVSQVADMEAVKHMYANSTPKNTILICRRFLTLWWRDKRVIIAGAVKNILMGVSVGGVFANNENPLDLSGAIFQAGLFIMLGAMQSASSFVVDRQIFSKHYECNFYSAVPFVLGRTLSTVPMTLYDVFVFATLLYYVIGLSDRDSASNFFIYIAILVVFAFTMQQQLAVFASFCSPSGVQGFSSVIVLFFTLFGGYIVAPNLVPNYYVWLYWINPFSWAFRALILNEFTSSRYDNTDQILEDLGFTINGVPVDKNYIWWSFVYMGGYFVISTCLCALGLTLATEKNVTKSIQIDQQAILQPQLEVNQQVEIPIVPVTLSFKDICYEVKASTGTDKLRLLDSVSGIFRPGRMCALMGTSGAGKTTLMDVIALRKRTGEISGEIRLNGWPQETISFRRCSGYVYQFDVQSPELTVRETIVFAARLRLNQKLFEDIDDINFFVDKILSDVNLTRLQHALVGEGDCGLSFEQKKLLSIAVELGAAPSIIFLDEPTSGLDSRAALLVSTTLKKISSEGRTIIATIHQPSSTVFEMFDELLLLKRGGHVVYHGPLGAASETLITYFHSRGAPRISPGENPANWMLKVMDHDDMKDLDEQWCKSENFNKLKSEIEEIHSRSPDPKEKLEFTTEYAASFQTRNRLISNRLRLIYWRSPAYNLTRLLVSGMIGFILGSIFILERSKTTYNEAEMQSRFSVVFLSFTITGIMGILSVIPVMTKIRDMFYRHEASGLYDSLSLGWALGSAEKLFIVVSSLVFVVVFLATGSLTDKAYKGGPGFWGFFCFNYAIYSYYGQLFVCLAEPSATAIILSSVFIGLNNFFSGLIVRPQLMVGGFYALPYYIAPGHYAYEGMITTLYRDYPGVVVASPGSDFFYFLGCVDGQDEDCEGPINSFIDYFFGGEFSSDNIWRNALILGFILLLARVLTWVALKYLKFG